MYLELKQTKNIEMKTLYRKQLTWI